MKDFYTLKDRYSNLNFTLIQGNAPQTDSTPAPKCKESLITTDGFTTNFTVPALPPGASKIINNGVSPAPTGKIVKIDDYSVSVTVKGSDGNEIKNLAVIPVGDDEINSPGGNTQVSSKSTSSSSSGSSSSSSSSSSGAATGAAAGIRSAQGESMPWMVASAVVASFLAGFLA